MIDLRRFRSGSIPTSLGAVVLFSVVLLVGCNAFGTGDTSSCDDVDECLANAETALNKGDYDSAVSALETAHDKEPDNAEVETQLSNALYQQVDLGVTDLKQLSEYITELEEDQASAVRSTASVGKSHGPACSVDPHGSLTNLKLNEAEDFAPFLDNIDLINRVSRILGLSSGELPESFDGLSQNMQASWYASAAFTNVAQVVLSIQQKSVNLGGSLNKQTDQGNIVYCAPDDAKLKDLQCAAYEVATRDANSLAEAIEYLQARREALGTGDGSAAEEVENALEDLSEAVKENVDPSTCP
jgi:tetratricopeptide (TPR) repeat protein